MLKAISTQKFVALPTVDDVILALIIQYIERRTVPAIKMLALPVQLYCSLTNAKRFYALNALN